MDFLHLFLTFTVIFLPQMGNAFYFNDLVHKMDRRPQKPQVRGFKYSNCGKPSDDIQVKTLVLSPSPLKIPGDITISAAGTTAKTLEGPIKVQLTVKKKILFWIEIPCVDNMGSCSYDDLCKLVKQIKCPPDFEKAGIPCECPVKKGAYNLPRTEVTIPKIPDVPSSLTEGEYQITAKLSTKDEELGCIFMELSLTKG